MGELVIYPAMVRFCLCCLQDRPYAHATRGLCLTCCAEEQTCPLCKAGFRATEESVGVFCPACWGELEATWKTTFAEDPVRAESLVRSRVTAAHPNLLGCRHGR